MSDQDLRKETPSVGNARDMVEMDVELEDSHTPSAPHSHHRQMLSDEAVATHQHFRYAGRVMMVQCGMWEMGCADNRTYQWYSHPRRRIQKTVPVQMKSSSPNGYRVSLNIE